MINNLINNIESEYKLSYVSQVLRVGILYWDVNNNKFIPDKNSFDIFGIGHRSKSLSSILKRVHEKDLEPLLKYLNETESVKAKCNNDHNFRYKHPNLGYIWLSIGCKDYENDISKNIFIVHVKDITENVKIKNDLKKNHEFELLINNISTSLQSCNSGSIEYHLKSSLEKICSLLSVEWGYFTSYNSEMSELLVSWTKKGYSNMRNKAEKLSFKHYPNFLGEEIIKKPLIINNTRDISLSKAEYRFAAKFGLKSFLSLPMYHNNQVIGSLVLASVSFKKWREEEISILEMFVNIAVDLLVRNQYERKMLESESHLNNIKEMVDVGTWSYDCMSDEFLCSDEIYSLFQLSRNSSFDDFIARFSTDDCIRLTKLINDCVKRGRRFKEKFIINLDDGKGYCHISGYRKISPSSNHKKIVGIIYDISEVCRYESEINSRAETASVLNKVFSLSYSKESFEEYCESALSIVKTHTSAYSSYIATAKEEEIDFVAEDHDAPICYKKVASLIGREPFDPIMSILNREDYLAIADIDNFPFEEGKNPFIQTMQKYSIKSLLIFPLKSFNTVKGLVGFSFEKAYGWSEREFQFLQNFTTVLALNYERFLSKKELIKRITELERYENVTVDRELRMIELKRQLKKLKLDLCEVGNE